MTMGGSTCTPNAACILGWFAADDLYHHKKVIEAFYKLLYIVFLLSKLLGDPS